MEIVIARSPIIGDVSVRSVSSVGRVSATEREPGPPARVCVSISDKLSLFLFLSLATGTAQPLSPGSNSLARRESVWRVHDPRLPASG